MRGRKGRRKEPEAGKKGGECIRKKKEYWQKGREEEGVQEKEGRTARTGRGGKEEREEGKKTGYQGRRTIGRTEERTEGQTKEQWEEREKGRKS